MANLMKKDMKNTVKRATNKSAQLFSTLVLSSALFSSIAFFSASAQAGAQVQNHAQAICDQNNTATCQLGELAEQRFYQAWATGDWSEFKQMMNTDHFIFQFPDGPLKGRSKSDEGYGKISEWIAHHIQFKNRIHHSERNIRMAQGDWYFFADEATGTFYGKDYKGSHFIGFRFDEGKMVEFREYVGDLTHWK